LYLAEYKMRIESLYLSEVLAPQPLRKTINRIKRLIQKNNLEFDAIAFSGMSGSLVASALSLEIDKPLILVRSKLIENCHGDPVEGFTEAGSVIIVDDFIETGETIENILTELSVRNIFCNGIVLYDSKGGAPMSDFNSVPIFF